MYLLQISLVRTIDKSKKQTPKSIVYELGASERTGTSAAAAAAAQISTRAVVPTADTVC